MSHPSKKKGSAFERAVADYLVANGHPYAERCATRGTNDRGDITGVPGFVIECKNEARIDLAGAVDEAEKERANANATYGIAVVKRRNRPVDAAYVVMSLDQFTRMTTDQERSTT